MSAFNDKKTMMSEFNEAAYQIARLNTLWSLCNDYAREGKLYKYKWVLDRIWVELSADATQKNEEKYYSRVKILNKYISQTKNSSSLYALLQEKEIFLKSLQEDVGKGGKKQQQFENIM